MFVTSERKSIKGVSRLFVGRSSMSLLIQVYLWYLVFTVQRLWSGRGCVSSLEEGKGSRVKDGTKRTTTQKYDSFEHNPESICWVSR